MTGFERKRPPGRPSENFSKVAPEFRWGQVTNPYRSNQAELFIGDIQQANDIHLGLLLVYGPLVLAQLSEPM